ncbi:MULTISPECIES: hypothetical protein [Bacteria]|uniref:hypothetical protein n=1 Tax=Bacteria TaxID=2 RepID=UPI003F2C2ACB
MSNFFNKKFFNLGIFSYRRISDKNLAVSDDKNFIQKFKEEVTSAVSFKKIYKKSAEPQQMDDSKYNENIDELVDIITKSKEVDGYISRTISNFKQKASKTGFKFISRDKSKAEQFEEYLEDILIVSGSSIEMFFQELLNNYISFGNVFIHKTIDITTGKIAKITILPSKGWTPLDSYGVNVIKWQFEVGDVSTVYTNKNITHLSFDKETHHVLGTPIPANALQDAAILRDVETENIQDYYDSLEKKMIFKVGDHKKPAKQIELDEVADKLNSSSVNEDLVISGHVVPELIQSKYNDKAVDVISNLKTRVLAALRSNSTNIGEKGAGRQDADTLDNQEDVVVEDIQSLLENQLNTKLFRELAVDLFGVVNSQNIVKLKFNETFTKKERREKHAIFKFLSGVTTLGEVREELGESETVDESKLYNNLFATQGNTLEGASNATNPSNQHGARGKSSASVKN